MHYLLESQWTAYVTRGGNGKDEDDDDIIIDGDHKEDVSRNMSGKAMTAKKPKAPRDIM